MPFQQPWYTLILPALPVLLAHLAGVVVAIILLVRRRSTPAILALIGFGVLILTDLASLGRSPLIGWLARQGGIRQFWTASTGVDCCCSIFDVAAIVCLIAAILQAVSTTSGERVQELAGEITQISKETAEEGA